MGVDLNGNLTLANIGVQTAVCRYDPTADDADSAYTLLPNVRCTGIHYREGTAPPGAEFRYYLDDNLAASFGWPSQFEQLFPIDAQGQYLVQIDDRLVVLVINPDGSYGVLFDGFAQIPEVGASGASQEVLFSAVHVAARKFDQPVTGRVQRDCDMVATVDGSADVDVDLACHFNPSDETIGSKGGYLGNCVPTASYTQSDDLGNYPVFLDPLMKEQGSDKVKFWHVGGAIKYLLATEVLADGETEDMPYVQWPTFSALDALLNAQYPTGAGVFAPGGSSTSTADITIRDYNAQNKLMPNIIADLLGYAGFVTCWVTEADENGLPKNYLRIYRRDGAATTGLKQLYLAASGSTLTGSLNNVSALRLARDANVIENTWEVETTQRQVEVSVYLAPGFVPTPGDETAPQRDKFRSSKLTGAPATQKRAYRWFVADETGVDGHWNAISSQWVTGKALDLTPVFPTDDQGYYTYVNRYRPGQRTAIALDSEGRPTNAVLQVYFGALLGDPYLEEDPNPAGWQTISRGWKLLDDRLGIEVTIEDPENWGTGNKAVGDIRAITWSISPPTPQQTFALRLTTVIEDDQRMPISVPKRVASPTKFSRLRIADGGDHFQYCAISPNSLNYTAAGGNGTDPYVVRDDTADAMTHAYQLRSAHEFPTLAGSVTIPYWTDYYQIGDRITLIEGRNVSLQTNVGADQGEAPCYAWVVGLSWTFDEHRQQTTLQLSDRRAELRNL